VKLGRNHAGNKPIYERRKYGAFLPLSSASIVPPVYPQKEAVMLKYAAVVIAVLFGCVIPASAQDQRAEMNKRIIMKMFQDLSTHNVEGITAAFHPQYITHGVGFSALGYPQDAEGDRRALEDIHAAAPGVKFIINKITAVGDIVDVNFTVRGGFHGRGKRGNKMLGLDPTGKPFAVQGDVRHRLVDGKIVETWINWDPQALKRQLQQ
jgi:predicted ester cyclase